MVSRLRHKAAAATGGLVFFCAFSVYLVTLAPTVTFWDSGELITAAASLGIPHQPGYPLYGVMGRLFSFIPLGSVAYRLNLLSAFFCALCVYVIYHVLRALSEDREKEKSAQVGEEADTRSGGLLAVPSLLALVLAFVRVFWSQAVVAEVYALNAFFTAALVLVFVKAAQGALATARFFMLSGFIAGLGLVNHESFVLYAPGLLAAWLMVPLEGGLRVRIRLALIALFFVLLGLSVYIYLPLRAHCGAGLDIGHPDTWASFAWTVRWGEYLREARDLPALLEGALARANLLDPRVAIGGVAGVIFAWRLIRANARLYLPLLLLLLFYLMGITALTTGSERDEKFGLAAKFFMPVFLLAVVLIGAAAGELVNPRGGRRFRWPLAAVLAFTTAMLLYTNRFPNDFSRHFMAFDYAENSLKSAGEKGVLFTWGDNGVFPLWYLHDVERYRDDVVLAHTPLMTYDWYLRDVNRRLGLGVKYMDPYFLGENVYRIVKAAAPARTVAYDYSTTHFMDLDTRKLTARGLVYFEGQAPPGDPWPWYVFRGVSDPAVFKGGMEKNIILIYEYQKKLRY